MPVSQRRCAWHRQTELAEMAEENDSFKSELQDQANTIRRLQAQIDRHHFQVGAAAAHIALLSVCCPPSYAMHTDDRSTGSTDDFALYLCTC